MKMQDEHDNSIIRHFQDLFIQMNNQLVEKDYIGYINLVEHLENLSVLSLNKIEFDFIRNVRKMQREYIEALNASIDQRTSNQTIQRQDTNKNAANNKNAIRQYYIEYPLTRIIERICIHSLKRSVLRSSSAVQVEYSIKEDVAASCEDIAYYLDNFGVSVPGNITDWIQSKKETGKEERQQKYSEMEVL